MGFPGIAEWSPTTKKTHSNVITLTAANWLCLTPHKSELPEEVSKPVFHGLIKGLPVSILFDTGSSVTVMSSECFNATRLNLESVNGQLFSYNRQHGKTKVTKSVNAPLELSSYKFEIIAIVAPPDSLRYDIVLGYDQIMKMNLILFPRQVVQPKPVVTSVTQEVTDYKSINSYLSCDSLNKFLFLGSLEVNQIECESRKSNNPPEDLKAVRIKIVEDFKESVKGLSKSQRRKVTLLIVGVYAPFLIKMTREAQNQKQQNQTSTAVSTRRRAP